MRYQVGNSGILEEWVSFFTAFEHCLPTNVNSTELSAVLYARQQRVNLILVIVRFN